MIVSILNASAETGTIQIAFQNCTWRAGAAAAHRFCASLYEDKASCEWSSPVVRENEAYFYVHVEADTDSYKFLLRAVERLVEKACL